MSSKFIKKSVKPATTNVGAVASGTGPILPNGDAVGRRTVGVRDGRRVVEEVLATSTFERKPPPGGVQQPPTPNTRPVQTTRPAPVSADQVVRTGTPKITEKPELPPHPAQFNPPPVRRQGVLIDRQELQPVAAKEFPESDKKYSETNPLYTEIFLPSGHHFNNFETLSARNLTAAHQAKFNRAAVESSIRHVVDAISSTLEPGVSAYDLTPQDFYFLMYWQRVNSYGKTPYIVSTVCDSASHRQKVEAKELEAKTLEIEELVNSTTLKTKYLDWPACQAVLESPEIVAFLEKYPQVDIERMHTVVEAEEVLPDHIDREDLVWLAGYAAFLEYRTEAGVLVPLLDRCKVIAEMSPDDIQTFDAYIAAVTAYGVSNLVTLRCRECGEPKTVQLTIDATTFLPGTFGRIFVG